MANWYTISIYCTLWCGELVLFIMTIILNLESSPMCIGEIINVNGIHVCVICVI